MRELGIYVVRERGFQAKEATSAEVLRKKMPALYQRGTACAAKTKLQGEKKDLRSKR